MGTRKHEHHKTDLFLVRVWLQDWVPGSVSGVNAEWHGRVQRVVDGESHHFNDWPGLVSLLVAMLDPVQQEEGQEALQQDEKR